MKKSYQSAKHLFVNNQSNEVTEISTMTYVHTINNVFLNQVLHVFK